MTMQPVSRFPLKSRPFNYQQTSFNNGINAAPTIPEKEFTPSQTTVNALHYRPQSGNLALPLTEYYLNKQQQPYPSFGGIGAKPPLQSTAANRQQSNLSSNGKQGQFNHVFNNQFSAQLERERIISEEKLKQRFDEAYQSK